MSSLLARDVPCPKCQKPLGFGYKVGVVENIACPHCNSGLELAPLPAYGQVVRSGQAGANRDGDGDAACFYHASKKAEIPCDRCGRFVCALCRLEIEGQNLCPTCLNAGGKVSVVEKERFRWDILVWWLTVLPLLLCCYVSPITSLAAIGIGFWKRNSKPSRIHRSQTRLFWGMGVSLLMLVAMVLGIIYYTSFLDEL